jgi:hypothetical protein
MAQLSKLGGTQRNIISHYSTNLSLSKYMLKPISSYLVKFSGLRVDMCILLGSMYPIKNKREFSKLLPMFPQPIMPIFRFLIVSNKIWVDDKEFWSHYCYVLRLRISKYTCKKNIN